MTSLNPMVRVGDQVMEPILLHRRAPVAEIKKRYCIYWKWWKCLMLKPGSSNTRMNCSGGMRQRAMIAMAIACKPKLLIADEPTTALDVTIQAQILQLMTNLKEQLDTSIILISHNLGVIASSCSRVIVMYGGTIVEQGTVREIFYSAEHPYTWGLLRSIPDTTLAPKTRLLPIPGSPPDLIAPATRLSLRAQV